MGTLLHFAERHWLSIVLLTGAFAAGYLAYKERSKIMIKDDE